MITQSPEQLYAGKEKERMIKGAESVVVKEASAGRGKNVVVLEAEEDMSRNNGDGDNKGVLHHGEVFCISFFMWDGRGTRWR